MIPLFQTALHRETSEVESCLITDIRIRVG